MYENYTPEFVKDDILARLTSAVDKSEGSFANDIVSAIGIEISKVYQSLDAVLPIVYVDATSGDYIAISAAEYGITRKAGTKATAVMTFVGTDGTIIPAGKVFQTHDGLQYVLDEAVTISGTVTGTVTAVDIGESYNVGTGEISIQLQSLSGLSSFSNAAAIGGTDPETDTSLFARLDERRKKTPTSGNPAHYKAWAKSVAGVGDAKVFPVWDGAGTVKVVLVNDDMASVSSDIVQAVSDYVEEQRPVGATVTVQSASGVSINISASIDLEGTASLAEIKDSFESALTTYLKSLIKTNFDKRVPAPPSAAPVITISYNRIVVLLLDIPGVADYMTFTINGGTSNVTLTADQIPLKGTVVIT